MANETPALETDYEIIQGDSFERVYQFAIEDDDGVQTPIDITNYEFNGDIKKRTSSLVKTASFTFDKYAGESGVVDTLRITLAGSTTSDMRACDYAYDIDGTLGDEVTTFLAGTFKVLREVTK